MGLGDALRKGHAEHPDKTALIVEDRIWTYAELDATTDRLAAGLISCGIRPGDRVALHFTNGAEIVCAYYACFKVGAIAVPLNTRMAPLELEYVLTHSGARLYIGQPDLFSAIDRLRSSLILVEQFFVSGGSSLPDDVRPLAELERTLPSPPPFPTVADAAVAVILYTSGTTARPKGVTHTHETLRALSQNGRELVGLRPDDVSGIALPTCHIFGLAMLLPAMDGGITAVMIPRFEPALVLSQLQQHGVTLFGGLPVMFNAMVHAPNAASCSLTGIRACLAGGDAVPTELHRTFKALFGVQITEGCGMTEVMPYSSNPLEGSVKAGSIGPPAPNVMLRLVDPMGRDVAPGEEGEVLVKSPSAMVGYWNDPEATKAAIQDGWVRTGDLARMDEDGYYWFVGRKKEIIIRGGSNISPLEVEETLYQHPAVREAGVVGVPSAAFGEIVVAFVSLRNGETLSEDALKTFASARIATYKVPERITFVPELPKGLTGKVHRKTLKEWATQN